MHTLIILFWLLVSPNGEGQLVAQIEPSQAQCDTDGNKMAAESQKLKDAGEIKEFFGACVTEDVDAAGKDARGSI